jgi:hypothetical protein
VSSGSLPAGLSLDSAAGQISGIPGGTGTFPFTLTATDAAGSTASRSYAITVTTAPLAVSSALPPATLGAPYGQTVAASGGQAPYNWTLASGTLPPGLTLSDTTGEITGTPTTAGTLSLQMAVSDSSTPVQQVTVRLSLAVTAPSRLQLSANGLGPATVSDPYTGSIGVSGGQYPYTWAVSSWGLPPGLTLADGAITGTPTATGAYPVTIQVTDSVHQTAAVSFNLTISKGTLVITTKTLPVAVKGISYSAEVDAIGPLPPDAAWGTTVAPYYILPESLGISGTCGCSALITGVPVGTGTTRVTVDLYDPFNTSIVYAQRTFNLTVEPGPPLAILNTSLPDASQGSAYAPQIIYVDGGVPPYPWVVVTGSLPPGLQWDPDGRYPLPANGIAYIAGTPTQPGLYTFTIKVTDSTWPAAPETAERTFTLIVWPSFPTITTAQQPATAPAGTAVADTATMSGGSPATGTVTFNLYSNPGCAGIPLYTDTEPLTNGSAPSNGYAATAAGTDYWMARYNGDGNHSPVTSACAGEPVTITTGAEAVHTRFSD